MCDRQQDSLGKCAYYQMPNHSGNVVISVEIEVELPDGTSFTTFFRSKWFLEKYIFKGNLPVGIRADAFEDYEVEEFFTG